MTLKEAIRKCFDFRETDVPPSFPKALRELDTTRLERGWASAIASVPGAPSFKSSFENVLKLIGHLDKS